MDLSKGVARSAPLFPPESTPDPITGSGGPVRRKRSRAWVWDVGIYLLAPLPMIPIGMLAVKLGGKENRVAVSLILLGAGGLLLTGAMLVILSGKLRRRRQRLARSVRTTGVVTAVEIEGTKGESEFNERTTVAYRGAGGQAFERPSASRVTGLKVGTSVEVLYDPLDPEWVSLARGERRVRALLIGLLAFFLAIEVGPIVTGVVMLRS